jgi:O-antigen/teichoic acid export membrane protein
MRRMLKIGALSLVLRIAGLLASFLMGVVLARALGPAEYGVYGLATTLVALGMTVGVLGTPQLAVRDLSTFNAGGDSGAISATLRQFGRATSSASLAIALAIIGAGWWVTRDQPQLASLMLPGALLVPLTALTTLVASELCGLGRLVKGQWMDTFARPALAFALTVVWLVSGMSLKASDALWIQVFVATVTALVSWVWIRQAVPPTTPKSAPIEPRPWLTAALFLMTVDLFRMLGGTYGIVMMGWLDDDVALGMFRVAFACNIVVALPVTILHVILAPNVAQLYKENRKPELQRLLSLTSAAMVAMVAPITVAAYLIGRPAIEIVFGAEYGPAWLPLFYLCVAQLAYGLFGMGPILLSMCQVERKLLTIYAVSTVAGFAAAYPLIIRHGATGAALAMILSNGLIGLLSWSVGRTQIGVDATFLPLLRRPFWRRFADVFVRPRA